VNKINKLLTLILVLTIFSSQIINSQESGITAPISYSKVLSECNKQLETSPVIDDLTVVESENHAFSILNMTYITPEPTFSKTSGFDILSIDGCDSFTGKPGEPVLPVKTVNILLPPSVTNATVEMIDTDFETLEGDFLIYPAQEAAITSKNLMIKTEPDRIIYALSSEWPSKTFEIVDVAKMREYNVLILKIYPLKYIPSLRKVVLYSRIKLSVSFEKKNVSSISSVKYSPGFEDLCKETVVNPSLLNTYAFSSQFSQEEYKYVIIAPSSFASAINFFADWKNGKGISTRVFTLEEITADYDGEDVPEQIRNCLIDSYEKWGIEWVLLCGDVNRIPVRMVYSPVGEGYDPYAPCDYYYADFTGDWDSDGDGKYGEISDDVDWYPDVYVGRLPARTASELTTMITKIINYEKNQPAGEWSRRMLFAGAFLNFENEDGDGYPETDVATLHEKVKDDLLPLSFSHKRLYEKEGLDPSDYASEEELSFSNLQDEIGAGYIYVTLGAHGAPEGMGRKVWVSDENDNSVPEEDEMSWPTMVSTAMSLTNEGLLSLVYADSCLTARIDYSSDSLAETMIKSPNGAIAYVGATRVCYYSVGWQLGWGFNQELDYRFWAYMFNDDSTSAKPGVALYKSKLWYSNHYDMTEEAHRHNLFVYVLLGDPELSVSPGLERDFTVTSIPETQSVQQGRSAAFTINIRSLGSFSSPVTLDLSGTPENATFNFSPEIVTPLVGGFSQSTLAITTTEETPTGTYILTVFGRSGVLIKSFQITLTVNVAGPDFNLTANPDLMTMQLSSQTNSTITVASLSGFTAPVSLEATRVPAGVTASFAPSPITPPSNGLVKSTLSINVSVTALPGTYVLTVRGVSGSTIHYCTVTLTIVGEKVYNLKISDLNAPSQVAEGQDFLVDVSVDYSFAFNTTIFVGVWDYDEESIIAGGVDDVTQTGTQIYVLQLSPPDWSLLWDLAAVVLYWNGTDWEYDPEGWYWDFEVLVSGAVDYSATVIDLDAPSQVELGSMFVVEMTIDYSLASLTEVGVGVWNYELAEYIAEETEELNGSGSQSYSFNLIAPSRPVVWDLSADVWYKMDGEWVHDIGVWYVDFQVEVSVPRYPDLTIIDAWIGDDEGIPMSKLMSEDEFYLWSILRNRGDESAEGYYITVYFEDELGVGGPGSLEVGVETYWYYGPVEAETGEYEIRWVVNEDHTIVETNYGNNERVFSFQVEESPIDEEYGIVIIFGAVLLLTVVVVVYFSMVKRRKIPVYEPEKTIPELSQITKCQWCETPIPPEAIFCPECGRKREV